MYSRKKGKSGSKRPSRKRKVLWQRYQAKEVESLVVKLGKSEKTPSQIGLELRDNYGIPDVKAITNRSITKILDDNNIKFKLPEDMTSLIRREIVILEHLEKNKKDMPSKRGMQLTESKIRRLVKYYKNIGRLPADWKYSRQKIKLLLD